MAIGAALYAVFSYLFNGTVFVVPSVSQVALRPAIAIPMFFGYAFGPVGSRQCFYHDTSYAPGSWCPANGQQL